MALKNIWKDKVDDVDDVMAEDINAIAQSVIELEEEFEDLPTNEDIEKRNEAVLKEAKAYADKNMLFGKNNFANALKATASGEIIRVDDVSPIEHTVKAIVSGKNLFNINNYKTVGGKLAFDISRLEIGEKYTLSSNIALGNIKISNQPNGYNSVTNYGVAKDVFTFTMSRNSNISESTAQYLFLGIDSDFITDISQLEGFEILIEKGDAVTEYEPYIDIASVTVTVQDGNGVDVTTYRPNADGTLEIDSFSPTMTILTDTERVNIHIEYNQDINAFVKDVENSGGESLQTERNYPLIEVNEPIISMQPNTFYKWQEVLEIEITLLPEAEGIVNEYCGEFISGETATSLICPSAINWVGDLVIESNKKYQFSIINNVGVIIGA